MFAAVDLQLIKAKAAQMVAFLSALGANDPKRPVNCHKTFLSPSEAYRATPTAGSIGLSHGRRAITRHVSVSGPPARIDGGRGEVVFPRIVLVVELLGIDLEQMHGGCAAVVGELLDLAGISLLLGEHVDQRANDVPHSVELGLPRDMAQRRGSSSSVDAHGKESRTTDEARCADAIGITGV